MTELAQGQDVELERIMQELGADSLDVVERVMEAEENFDVL